MLSRRRQTTSVYYTRLPSCTSLLHYMYASRSWTARVEGRWVSLSFVSIIAYRSWSNQQLSIDFPVLRRAYSFDGAIDRVSLQFV